MARVTTIYGEMDDCKLVKSEHIDQNGVVVVEYYLQGELVHRSVTAQLKGQEAAASAKI